jgi:hypothetical protein
MQLASQQKQARRQNAPVFLLHKHVDMDRAYSRLLAHTQTYTTHPQCRRRRGRTFLDP